MYRLIKRLGDLFLAALLLILATPIILLAIIIASFDTQSFGLFRQRRIGVNETPFYIYKIKTMRDSPSEKTTVTGAQAHRITPSGKLFRKLKIDELPQLWNVLIGDMSFVGPRPDTWEMYEALSPEQRKIIYSIKPGITSPATLKFADEDKLIMGKPNPLEFYNENILPQKIEMNEKYVQQLSFLRDMLLIFLTIKRVIFK